MACDVPCDDLSCKEVGQVEGCFQRFEDGVAVVGNGKGDTGGIGDMVETSGTGGGAVQVPGVGVGGLTE
jgi:hypothetical protein